MAKRAINERDTIMMAPTAKRHANPSGTWRSDARATLTIAMTATCITCTQVTSTSTSQPTERACTLHLRRGLRGSYPLAGCRLEAAPHGRLHHLHSGHCDDHGRWLRQGPSSAVPMP